MKTALLSLVFGLLLSLLGCSQQTAQLSPLAQDAVILAFGDSLTFGTGSGNSSTQSYPAILESLTGRTVVNDGVPGEVSADGLIRLAQALDETSPDLVILCHGGNDLIRKLGEGQLKSNIEKMVTLIQQSGAEVVLLAVPRFSLTLQVPELYKEVATEKALPIEDSVFKQVIANNSLKADTVHPNAAGYKVIAQRVYELLQSSGAL